MTWASPFWGVLAIALVWLVSFAPIFAAADSPPNSIGRRDLNLDGLRGFLAVAVVIHHEAIYHNYLSGIGWSTAGMPVLNRFGQCGTDLFFLMTGYLFWGKLIREGGRPNWLKLYIGRAFRLLPLYWFMLAIVIVGVATHTGVRLAVPASEYIKSIVEWSLGGVFPQVAINGYSYTWLLVAGVTWTLRYEWGFYAALAPAALLCRGRWSTLALPVAFGLSGLVYTAWRGPQLETAAWYTCLTLLSLGAFVAALRLHVPDFRLREHFASVVAAIVLGIVLVFLPTVNAAIPVALLAVFFLLVANNATLFGLLQSRSARRLGDVSYGIYLLQGVMLATLFHFHPVREIALQSPWLYWTIGLAGTLALVAISVVSHVAIERPGIKLGRRVAGYLDYRIKLRHDIIRGQYS